MCRRTEEEEGCPPPATAGSRGQGGGGGRGRGGRVQPGEPLSGESRVLLLLSCLRPGTESVPVHSDLRAT